MGKVGIFTLERAPLAAAPQDGEIAVEGRIETRRVIGEPERPLHLWIHRLAPGAAICWQAPSIGRVVFLWEGAARVNGARFSGDSAVVVEHRAHCRIEAGPEGCTLLEFHERDANAAAGAGGCVHALGAAQAPRFDMPVGRMAVFADGGCPTCRLWLHENGFDGAHRSPRHSHSEPEIIVCKQGRMNFGAVELERGGVLATGSLRAKRCRCS